MLFINPSILPETQPEVFKPFFRSVFPMAIGYLAGYLREKNNAKIVIYDEQIKGWLKETQLRKEIQKIEGPKIVGIPCLTPMAKRVKQIISLIKDIDSEIIVVLGGIHPTILPEESLKRFNADIVVRGEGEETLGEIYTAIRNKMDINEIKGISYKANGEIVHNPARELLNNLEEIPPFPYDLFENNIDQYRDFGYILSSRGCPHDCIFCSQRIISGRRYRLLPNYRVVDKIKLLVDKYKQTKILFTDDSFTIHKKRTFSLIDDIIASGYHEKAGFIIQTRGKEVSWDLLMKLKEANVFGVGLGVETGSERLMSTLNKDETVQDNVKAIELINKAGLISDASFIMGLPTETKKERKISSKLSRNIPLDGVRFNVAIPYPGTKLFEIAKQEGRLNKNDDWSNFSNQYYMLADDIPYSPEGCTRSELVYETFIANLKFSIRPKQIFRILFSSFGAGGGVILMQKRWYVSLKIWGQIIVLLSFLLKRYCMIIIKGKILSRISSR